MSDDDGEITGVRDLPHQFRGFATKVMIDHRQLRKEFDEMVPKFEEMRIQHVEARGDLKWIKGAIKVVLGALVALIVHAISTHLIK